MPAVRRPSGVLVATLSMRQLCVLARCNIHDENVESSLGVPSCPRVRDHLPIGMPGRVGSLALTGSEAFNVAPIHIHPVNLLRAGPAGHEHRSEEHTSELQSLRH